MKFETQNLDLLFRKSVSMHARAQAIEDGVLFDVSEDARKMGFRLPVALTACAWNDCVAWEETDRNRDAMQDESSRLWDVLWRTLLAARKAQSNRYPLQLYRVPKGESAFELRLTTLHAHVGRGDDGELVMTILMPDEH